MKKADILLILENEVEAQVLTHALKKREIPHLLKSYHDSAYDGLFQLQKGWGHLEAPAGFHEKILVIYRELFGKEPARE